MATVKWFEEYEKCGCVSEYAARKSDLDGYCPTHGNDRSNVFKVTRGSNPSIESRKAASRDGK